MTHTLIQEFEAQYTKSSVPKIKTGYHVRVHQKIKEGSKERVQVFEGMVISVNPGNGLNQTFTVRKISNGVGVEKTFMIHSPNIVKIEVKRAHKVRRAKINYMRERSGKALRLKEVPLALETLEFADPTPVAKAEVAAEPAAETAAATDEAEVAEAAA